MGRTVKIQSVKNQTPVIDQCRIAESFLDRLVGLIGTKVLREQQGLLITRCNNIHMWCMSIPIDLIFVQREATVHDRIFVRVTSLRPGLKPWRIFPVADSQATDALEVAFGTIARTKVQVGDELCIG